MASKEVAAQGGEAKSKLALFIATVRAVQLCDLAQLLLFTEQ